MNNHDEQRNKTIICDHIIWTTSLGYLKKNFQTIFAGEPELIREKQNAIANLGFGTINKVRDLEMIKRVHVSRIVTEIKS